MLRATSLELRKTFEGPVKLHRLLIGKGYHVVNFLQLLLNCEHFGSELLKPVLIDHEQYGSSNDGNDEQGDYDAEANVSSMVLIKPSTVGKGHLSDCVVDDGSSRVAGDLGRRHELQVLESDRESPVLEIGIGSRGRKV